MTNMGSVPVPSSAGGGSTRRWDLAFRFHTLAAPGIDEFELQLNAQWDGQVTGVFGPSGCGKSTLIEVLLGLKPRAQVSGQAFYQGHTLFSTGIKDAARASGTDTTTDIWLPPAARRLGWVPQDNGLLPHLTVQSNLKLTADRNRYVQELPVVVELLALTPLLRKRPRELSGGEKQRVAVARALLCPHDVLLLDEPLAALDKPRRSKLITYLLAVKERLPVAMLYVTHDWQEILQLCDHVLVLDGGRLIWQGPPSHGSPL